MSIAYLAAEDEIFGVVNAAFVGAATAQELAYVPQIHFPGQVVSSPENQIYAECSFVVVKESQVSLSKAGGTTKYESIGLLAVQVYSPKVDSVAFRQAKKIAGIVRDAFRQPSPSAEVWFRDQRLTPAASSETKNQINVVITCTYETEK